MSGFLGMDTDAARGHADALEIAASRLGDLLGDLDGRVASVDWTGPDADAFRSDWAAVRRTGDPLDDELRAAGDHLRQQADEQDEVSSGDDDGSGFFDWIADGIDWIVDTVGDGIEWVTDTVGDIIEGAKRAVSDVFDYLETAWKNLGEWWESFTGLVGIAFDAIATGRWPRLTEVIVGLIDFGLDTFNLGYHLLTGEDLHLADDGTGFADPPVLVAGDDPRFQPPGDLAAIANNINQSYGSVETGEVSMTVVGQPPESVIVNIPGTEQWGVNAGDNPFDLTSNSALAGPNGYAASSEATADAIQQLFADAGIPPGTPIMLTGHSQGGMVATSLASDPAFTSEFNVTNVMTVGSPVDNYPVQTGVDVLNIQHGSDPVPMIDAQGMDVQGNYPGNLVRSLGIGPGGTETVTLPSPAPGELWNVDANHGMGQYETSIAEQLQDPTSQLSQYSQDPSLQPFLTADPDEVQQYTAELHRDN